LDLIALERYHARPRHRPLPWLRPRHLSSGQEAEAAISALNEQELDGRRITVSHANARGGGGGGGR
jgi:hypothetical protein